MGDWRKAQYRTDPPQDPNSDIEDAGMVAKVLLPGLLLLSAVALLLYWLLAL